MVQQTLTGLNDAYACDSTPPLLSTSLSCSLLTFHLVSILMEGLAVTLTGWLWKGNAADDRLMATLTKVSVATKNKEHQRASTSSVDDMSWTQRITTTWTIQRNERLHSLVSTKLNDRKTCIRRASKTYHSVRDQSIIYINLQEQQRLLHMHLMVLIQCYRQDSSK